MSDVRSFFDDPPAQRHSPESVAAASEIKVNAGTLRALVLDLLAENGPLTDEEIQEALDMNPSTERPRRIELVKAGLVGKCGRRPTRSGRQAALWGVVE